ncbi:MAG: alpha/beta fold hydrolase, partial [Terracidiphilus sp.]
MLYHPAAAVTRTPAAVGLSYESVDFDVSASGAAQLRGWWIARPKARYTAIYLHSANGNLGDTVDALNRLYGSGFNVFAFDYRGYGQSHFARPSEEHWRQDANWALQYLTQTRHIDPATIVLDGSELGANLALDVAAKHQELAGVVVDSPLKNPVDAVLN